MPSLQIFVLFKIDESVIMHCRGYEMSLNQQCLKSGAFSRTALNFKRNQRSTVVFDHWIQLIFSAQRIFFASGFSNNVVMKCVIVISMPREMQITPCDSTVQYLLGFVGVFCLWVTQFLYRCTQSLTVWIKAVRWTLGRSSWCYKTVKVTALFICTSLQVTMKFMHLETCQA